MCYLLWQYIRISAPLVLRPWVWDAVMTPPLEPIIISSHCPSDSKACWVVIALGSSSGTLSDTLGECRALWGELSRGLGWTVKHEVWQYVAFESVKSSNRSLCRSAGFRSACKWNDLSTHYVLCCHVSIKVANNRPSRVWDVCAMTVHTH